MKTFPILQRICFLFLFSILCFITVQAQTTAFNYQGKLTDGTSAANGTFEMQFSLFNAETGGNQVGSVITNNSVSVVNGVFNVKLDFGEGSFPGAARYLEVSVKKPSDAGYTTLLPRQQITASPYALRTLSATFADSLSNACVGCVDDSKISSVAGSKVSGSVSHANHAATSDNATNATNAANATTAATANNATNATNAAQLGGVAASNYVQTTDSRLSNPTITINVSSNSSISWLIGNSSDYSSGSNVNPTLTLQRGVTYRFNVTVNGHPFRIASSNSGPAYNTGVTNNDVMAGVLTFKVPMDAPNTLYYYCLAHPNMNGIINIQ